VRAADLDGRYLDALTIDPMFRMSADARGPRDNLVFEGLSFSVDGRSLWVSMEGPLIQDGSMPTRTHGAWSRFSRHDRTSDGRFGPLAGQIAYPIDPIPDAFAITMRHALNGVSEILAYDELRFLVLERALLIGSWWHIRLYLADSDGASDVGEIESLAAPDDLPDTRFTPMTKRLVLDFDTLDITVDNLEGMCFGPVLANGHRTLILVSDDNFNPIQKTQFLAFEILPAADETLR